MVPSEAWTVTPSSTPVGLAPATAPAVGARVSSPSSRSAAAAAAVARRAVRDAGTTLRPVSGPAKNLPAQRGVGEEVRLRICARPDVFWSFDRPPACPGPGCRAGTLITLVTSVRRHRNYQ